MPLRSSGELYPLMRAIILATTRTGLRVRIHVHWRHGNGNCAHSGQHVCLQRPEVDPNQTPALKELEKRRGGYKGSEEFRAVVGLYFELGNSGTAKCYAL